MMRLASVWRIWQQLGTRINEFNGLIKRHLCKIVVENGNVAEVVKSQGTALEKFMNEVKVPCWRRLSLPSR